MRRRNRWSLVSLSLGLVLGAGCGLFGLHGDDSVVRIECTDGRPALEGLYVGVPHVGFLAGEAPDTLSSSCGGAGSPDLAFQLVPPQGGTYELRLYAEFDAVLYGVASPCDAPRIDDCVDENGTFANEVLTVELEAGVPYAVVVDGFTSESQGSFTLEAVLVAAGGETDSDGDTGDPMSCAAVDQTLETIWTGDRWMGTASGTTTERSDAFASMCGGSGRPDEAWRFVPPAPGIYRISLSSYELQGSVSVRDASCTEVACDDGAASSGSPHMPTLEAMLSSGEHVLVVDGAGAHQLVVEQMPDAIVSSTCGQPCADAAGCTFPEACLGTTQGQICLPEPCQTCFAEGLTCWSYPYTCGWIACS